MDTYNRGNDGDVAMLVPGEKHRRGSASPCARVSVLHVVAVLLGLILVVLVAIAIVLFQLGGAFTAMSKEGLSPELSDSLAGFVSTGLDNSLHNAASGLLQAPMSVAKAGLLGLVPGTADVLMEIDYSKLAGDLATGVDFTERVTAALVNSGIISPEDVESTNMVCEGLRSVAVKAATIAQGTVSPTQATTTKSCTYHT